MMVEQFESARKYALRLHGNRKFMGTDATYASFVERVALEVRFAGGDMSQTRAGAMWDAIAQCQEVEPEIREVIRGQYGDEVLRIVEIGTLGEGKSWEVQRHDFVARLEALDDDDPALLVMLAKGFEISEPLDWSNLVDDDGRVVGGFTANFNYSCQDELIDVLCWFVDGGPGHRPKRPGIVDVFKVELEVD